ncbi:MAG TPA: toll/interleukin-1 receptor domain-containing protein [Chthoniobacterales bacterium]|nr:toll/interleukin-1 receptor domain-containing protein [Chthoniobacterales bacterium]
MLTTTPQVREMLERLVSTGFFGRNLAEAAERFVTRGLQDHFLSSPQHEVFVSYSATDRRTARELTELLEQKGLTCFLAEKSIATGARWKEEIRKALIDSRIAVIILTPNSVTSTWVLYEASACWALGKPMAPAALYVSLGDLPEIVRDYQCRTLETAIDKQMFADEIVAFCAAFKPKKKG